MRRSSFSPSARGHALLLLAAMLLLLAPAMASAHDGHDIPHPDHRAVPARAPATVSAIASNRDTDPLRIAAPSSCPEPSGQPCGCGWIAGGIASGKVVLAAGAAGWSLTVRGQPDRATAPANPSPLRLQSSSSPPSPRAPPPSA